MVSGRHRQPPDAHRTSPTRPTAARRRAVLEKVDHLNKNTSPTRSGSPFVTSGIPRRTPAMTTRGLDAENAARVADLIADAFEHRDDAARLRTVHARFMPSAARHPVCRPSRPPMMCPARASTKTPRSVDSTRPPGTLHRRRRNASAAAPGHDFERVEFRLPTLVKPMAAARCSAAKTPRRLAPSRAGKRPGPTSKLGLV